MARAIWSGALALLAGLGLLTVGLALAGYDAGPALAALFRGALGSADAFLSATLVRAIPLTILGLGVGLAFRAGALNIGAEGQLYAGAIAATWMGQQVASWPSVLAIPAVLAVAAVAGALWILVPVVLRLRFGVLEVISTLLLNFIAVAMVSYMVTGPLQEASRVYPQSDPIAVPARLPHLPGSRLHLGFLLAAGLAVLLWGFFRYSATGFKVRAAGLSPRAALVSGRISVNQVLGGALLASGAFGGLGGGVEVSGVTYNLFASLSPGYGFTAIAVALLARLHPIGILGAGILFGALEAGAQGMQRDAGVPAVAVTAVEAVVIVAILLADARVRRIVTEPAS
jgi:general nucleoside transport system permease protein